MLIKWHTMFSYMYFTALLVKTELNIYLLKVPFLAQEILIETTCDENVEEITDGRTKGV